MTFEILSFSVHMDSLCTSRDIRVVGRVLSTSSLETAYLYVARPWLGVPWNLMFLPTLY